MTSERWRQVEAVFNEAIECPVEERSAFLDRACGGDQDLRREVESLLSSDALGQPLLTISPGQEVDRSGRKVGAYQLIRPLGQGGMGVVYLGVRIDDQYRKQVAIKLLKRGMDTDFMLERFRLERQILANLEHPFIARLIDGGATEDGLPYFVMEYVEGVPITTYCDQHKLGIRERLRLFRMVCEAVQHAHQHLVVHRDIKPSNILTTAEGVPKLLDFGIAKVIDPERPAGNTLTRPDLRMLTPEYASPEQVKGLPISTATDVYSLGVVLYELLAGKKPHRFTSESLPEMEKTICELEPERPSTVAGRNAEVAVSVRKQTRRQLAGDLDTIVLTAMRKDPQRRYSSVANLAEDLRRHEEGLPILAHPDRWSYRAAKFVGRHRIAVTAALLVLASLIGGIITTTVQARRAERRFQMVRGLGHSVLFDLYPEMARLPGSTALRAKSVQTVAKYLDDLARDEGQDPDLDLELAEAYETVASLQGQTFGANLGQGENALISYRKALALFERLPAGGANHARAIRGLIDTHIRVSGMEAMLGNPVQAEIHSQKAAAIAQAAFDSGNPPIPPATKINLYFRLADSEYQRGSSRGELAFYQKALEVVQEWASVSKQPEVGGQLIEVLRNVGSAQARNGDLAAAKQSYQEGRRIAEGWARKVDTGQTSRYSLVSLLAAMGDVLAAPDDPNFGDRAGAIREYREALRISETLAEMDPKNVNARRLSAGCNWRLAMILAPDQPVQALAHSRQALRLAEEIRAGDPRNMEYRYHASRALLWMGESQRALGQNREAVTSFRGALDLQKSIETVSPGRIWNLRVFSRTYAGLGEALLADGKWDQAWVALAEGLGVADRMLERAPASLSHQIDRADVLEAMARFHRARSKRPEMAASGRREALAEAKRCYQASLAIWQDWRARKAATLYADRRLNQVTAALNALN